MHGDKMMNLKKKSVDLSWSINVFICSSKSGSCFCSTLTNAFHNFFPTRTRFSVFLHFPL